MFSRISFLGLVLASALGGFPNSLQADPPASKKVQVGKIQGVLTAVTATSVSIRTTGRKIVTLIVNSATKVELNGVRVQVTALRVGRPAQALFDPATNIATKVESR